VLTIAPQKPGSSQVNCSHPQLIGMFVWEIAWGGLDLLARTPTGLLDTIMRTFIKKQGCGVLPSAWVTSVEVISGDYPEHAGYGTKVNGWFIIKAPVLKNP
jgi:hypothetical protein